MKKFDKYIKKIFDADDTEYPNMDKNWGKLNQRMDDFNSNGNTNISKVFNQYFWKSMVALLILSNVFLFYKMKNQYQNTAVLFEQNHKLEQQLDSFARLENKDKSVANNEIKDLNRPFEQVEKSVLQENHLNSVIENNKKASARLSNNTAKEDITIFNNENSQETEDSYQKKSNSVKSIMGSGNIEIPKSDILTPSKDISVISNNQKNTNINSAQKSEDNSDILQKRQLWEIVEGIDYPISLHEVRFENILELPLAPQNSFVKPIQPPTFNFKPNLKLNAFLETGVFLNNRELTTISGNGLGAECMLTKNIGLHFSFDNQENEFRTKNEKLKDFDKHIPYNDPNKPPRQDIEFRSLMTKIETNNYNLGLTFKLPNRLATPSISMGHNWANHTSNPIFLEFRDTKDGLIKQDISVSNNNKISNIWYLGLGIEKSYKNWTLYTNSTYYQSNDLDMIPNRFTIQLGIKYQLF